MRPDSAPLATSSVLSSLQPEFARGVARAERILSDFARRHGWRAYLLPPLFDSVEVFRSQQELWARMRDLENIGSEHGLPTDGLAAGLVSRVLLTVTPEEYARARPKYASRNDAWPRLLAHELAHGLHARLVHGNEGAMGPKWFFEGFAIVASGQRLCSGVRPSALDEALLSAHAQGSGSYGVYDCVLRFLLKRLPLEEMVRNAGNANFEDWLRREYSRRG